MIFRIQSFRQAAFWSTGINAFSQGMALVFSMVMAAVFGAQDSTDVLYYCIGIFALLTGLFQAVNVSVLIPETMRRRHQAGEADAMAFINRFFAAFGVMIVGLTAWILRDPAASMTMISRFSEEALRSNSRLVFILLASLPLQMAAQLLLDVLVSYKFLALPATLSCVNRILNIAFVLAFHRQLGVMSVALGMLIGFALQVALNLHLLRRAIHWNPFLWRTRIGAAAHRNVAWTGLGTLASTAAGYLPLFLFSGFSAGALTTLNYARRLSATPTQLLTSQISNVTGIKFNELAARNELGELAAVFDRLCRALVLGLVPLAYGLMLASHSIAEILFGRGDFNEAAVASVGKMFGLLILVLPLEAMNFLVARYFVARQAIAQALPLQLAGAAIQFGAVFWSVRQWGEYGYPIGLMIFWVLYFMALAVAMPRLFEGISIWPLMGSWLRTMGACAAVAGVVWAVGRTAGIQDWNPWASAIFRTILFGALYGGLLKTFPPDEKAMRYGAMVWRQMTGRKWSEG